ncbi:MAG: hypothetical protein ACK4YF_06535 [Exilispira sp.]
MKRSIIILLSLTILLAMPVLAEAPSQENAPLAGEGQLFLGELSQLSEEELIDILGNLYYSVEDPEMIGSVPTFDPKTNNNMDKKSVLKMALYNAKIWIKLLSGIGFLELVDIIITLIIEDKPITYENIITQLLDLPN